MITEPRLHLIFGQDLPAGRNKEQDILKEYIVKDSVEQNSVFCKDLKSSSDTVSLLLEKNCPTILDFLCVEEPVQAVLYDGLTTVYTGYVSASYSWVIGHTGAKTFKVTLENKATKLLSVPYIEVGYNSLDGKVSDIIQSICGKTGLEISSETQIPDYSVCRAISSEDTCKSILTDILYEGGWVYRFDQNGKLVFYEISFSDTTDVTVSSDDLAVVNNNAITLTKKARQHSGAAIEYQAIARKENVLVYSCTTGRDEGHPFCNLVIPVKNFFNGGEINSQYAKLYVEAVNAGSDAEISNGEILTIYNARIVKQTAYGGLTESVESSGKYLCIKAENTGGTDKAYYRFDVYADVVYVASTDKILSGTIKDPVREAFRYVHDKAIAEKHARLLDKYSSVSGQNYTFQTTRDILLGSVIKLIDSKISHIEVYLFIYSKKETKSPYYQYQGVPVSNIRQSELIHETTSPSKNPSYITPSAYREAVANGYKGTESEWLKSVSKNLKYIWSSSDTEVVTQKSSYWKFAGKWMMYGRGLIGDIHEKDWLDTWDKVMQERTDEYCYLWAKVGDDGQPFLFQGVSPMDFSVVFSPSAYIINPRELSGKQITITLTRLNGIKGVSTATLIDNPAGITIEESETDVWIAYVASSPATALSFSVKITCGAVEKVYSVTGMMSSTQNMCAGYFTDSLPSSGESMNYITGDTALLNGKPYKYTGDGWVEITTVEQYEMLPYQLAVDTGDCMLANGDITESLGVMWGYFGHIYAKAALIERIRTSDIEVQKCIRGGDYNVAGDLIGETGFWLGVDGKAKITNAFLNNITIGGRNSSFNSEEFETIKQIPSEEYSFVSEGSFNWGGLLLYSTPDLWNFASSLTSGKCYKIKSGSIYIKEVLRTEKYIVVLKSKHKGVDVFYIGTTNDYIFSGNFEKYFTLYKTELGYGSTDIIKFISVVIETKLEGVNTKNIIPFLNENNYQIGELDNRYNAYLNNVYVNLIRNKDSKKIISPILCSADSYRGGFIGFENGLLIQFGYVSMPSKTQIIYLPISYRSIDEYAVFLSFTGNTSRENALSAGNKTTNEFKVYMAAAQNNDLGVQWMTIGYTTEDIS